MPNIAVLELPEATTVPVAEIVAVSDDPRPALAQALERLKERRYPVAQFTQNAVARYKDALQRNEADKHGWTVRTFYRWPKILVCARFLLNLGAPAVFAVALGLSMMGAWELYRIQQGESALDPVLTALAVGVPAFILCCAGFLCLWSADRMDLFYKKCRTLHWSISRFQGPLYPGIPTEGFALAIALTREMVGYRFEIEAHVLGADPILAGVQRDSNGSIVHRAFIYGWVDKQTRLVECNGDLNAVRIPVPRTA
jgi:hypothetical protein